MFLMTGVHERCPILEIIEEDRQFWTRDVDLGYEMNFVLTLFV